ncbi:MAG: VWA domain-containing protein, partial [Planctomycetes bacterium]|nr:VWA domain-containing protein [Planctomycetota bacterium]
MAIAVSLSLHVILMSGLALFKFSQTIRDLIEITSVIDQEQDFAYKFDTTVSDQVGNDGDVNAMTSSIEAANQLAKDPQQEIEKSVADEIELPVPVTEELPQPSKSEVLSSVSTLGATEHVGGVEGAVDRLAWEIANSLREHKTLVVWLFDVSPSLSARRQQIADRIENVYEQVTSLNAEADKALKSAVATFSEKTQLLTREPLDTAEELVKVVRNIKSESSGLENTFAAVNMVIKHFQSQRTQMHRDVMIVIVTDEAGSDPSHLEQAISAAKRFGMRCYCIGNAAPFGKETTEAPFTLDDGETVIGVMHRGPESYYPERVRLGYWGAQGWDLEDLSSSYGPYGLTRLCAETNGLYLISDESRGHKFDPQVMRNYAPDYRPIRLLDADISKNKAKQGLLEVCRLLRIDNVPLPRLDFPAETDTVLRQVITESQRPLAEFEYKLDALLKILEPGEKDRAKLKDSRSRAGYDLAMGRVLAMRSRGFGYNSMLAEMKGTPRKFDKSDNNI